MYTYIYIYIIIVIIFKSKEYECFSKENITFSIPLRKNKKGW